MNSCTIFYGTYGPGEVFLKASYSTGTKVGSIQLKDKIIASIFASSNSSTDLAIISEEKIPDEMVFAATVALFQQLPCKEVILFDSYLASNYITFNRQERETVPIVKYLRSSLGRKSSQLDMLSAPNLTTGISAAILTYCELHQLPCVALFTLQESSLGKALITDETTAAFATALEDLDVTCPSLDYDNLQSILRSRKFGKDSGRIDADHHRMYT
ncbi:hypothetical protein K450DRAFT_222625 [Umbelopsis ramanniana AG]|uniref:Proteasome assembly chaperone 1 n=1 Tax=Umbelopsis ramanniana AG TaxID=1314678 RepID=A0AAD5EJY3_UMBRA|nr:uncharacterized protein K450DRAFT_222625 [Umbelopsis ramanniana AG]KAI8583750.1 hypothetical protein K450DRAFT_222625 [Umbelopsis ramanniana AG]